MDNFYWIIISVVTGMVTILAVVGYALFLRPKTKTEEATTNYRKPPMILSKYLGTPCYIDAKKNNQDGTITFTKLRKYSDNTYVDEITVSQKNYEVIDPTGAQFWLDLEYVPSCETLSIELKRVAEENAYLRQQLSSLQNRYEKEIEKFKKQLVDVAQASAMARNKQGNKPNYTNNNG